MWNKIKERFLTKQFLTFGIIGVINTLVSQGLYMVFVGMEVAVGTASILSDVLSMIGSYFMNTYFTYKQKPTWKSAVTFPLSYIPGIIISALMVVLVVDILHAPKMFAKILSLPLYIPVNFLCMSFIMKKFGKK
ncbi:MAG: GtrA family protein [Solobacterium sp.]|nr:GtrA family protein [Solobacterium sp.]MBQ6222717.1 GtrA family protein [Solobacterium sp.]